MKRKEMLVHRVSPLWHGECNRSSAGVEHSSMDEERTARSTPIQRRQFLHHGDVPPDCSRQRRESHSDRTATPGPDSTTGRSRFHFLRGVICKADVRPPCHDNEGFARLERGGRVPPQHTSRRDTRRRTSPFSFIRRIPSRRSGSSVRRFHTDEFCSARRAS